MSECRALGRKNKKITSIVFVVSSLSLPMNTKSEFEAEDFSKEYLSFLSQGFISFVGTSNAVPIVILTDTSWCLPVTGVRKCLAFWLSVRHWNVSPITRSIT